MTTTVPRDQIVRLMQIPESERHAEWIESSLQSAIALELSTIPPYLCGLWSIKDSTSQAARLIRDIVLDEMFHLGLVCNMLTGIGGTPGITTAAKAQTYPGPLPGGVNPTLRVYLSGLTKEYVCGVFMAIEMPEHPVARALEEGYPTIGAFYDALKLAFLQVQPTISTDKQLSAPIRKGDMLKPLTNLLDVVNAIELIKQQGEGTAISPDAPQVPQAGEEFAHYYKFGEIYHGHTLIQVDGEWVYQGAVVPFPEVYPMGEVPQGGWPNPASDVRGWLHDFNVAYTAILRGLDNAWAKGNQQALRDAVDEMPSLTLKAVPLLGHPLPGGGGNYGPEFRVTA